MINIFYYKKGIKIKDLQMSGRNIQEVGGHQITMYFCKTMALLGSSLTGEKAITNSTANRVIIINAKIRAI